MRFLIFLLALFLSLSFVFSHPLERPLAGESSLIEGVHAAVANVVDWTSEHCPTNKPALKLLHTKTHSCVASTFTPSVVSRDSLRQGLWDPQNGLVGQPIDTIVRFSNGLGALKSTKDMATSSDSVKDVRGMAVKMFLRGPINSLRACPVAGSAPCSSSTFDLLMTTAPIFFASNVEDAAPPLVKTFEGRIGRFMMNPFNLFRYGAGLVKMIFSGRGASLTGMHFFTAVPSAIGSSAAQLKWIPCAPVNSPPSDGSSNMYQNRLRQELSGGRACFNLMALEYEGEQRTPIENAKINWEGRTSQPWVNLGTLNIPQQVDFVPNSFCTELPFNPFNAPVAHEPLGGISRIRRIVYTKIHAKRRLLQSGVPFTSDISWEQFLAARIPSSQASNRLTQFQGESYTENEIELNSASQKAIDDYDSLSPWDSQPEVSMRKQRISSSSTPSIKVSVEIE